MVAHFFASVGIGQIMAVPDKMLRSDEGRLSKGIGKMSGTAIMHHCSDSCHSVTIIIIIIIKNRIFLSSTRQHPSYGG